MLAVDSVSPPFQTNTPHVAPLKILQYAKRKEKEKCFSSIARLWQSSIIGPCLEVWYCHRPALFDWRPILKSWTYIYMCVCVCVCVCVCPTQGDIILPDYLPCYIRKLSVPHDVWQDCLHPHENVETNEFFCFLHFVSHTSEHHVMNDVRTLHRLLFLLENIHTKKAKHQLLFDRIIWQFWTYFESYASSVIRQGTTVVLRHAISFSPSRIRNLVSYFIHDTLWAYPSVTQLEKLMLLTFSLYASFGHK